MSHRAGAVIILIVRNHDLLTGVVHFGKGSELPVPGLILCNRICCLNVILPAAFTGYEINLMRAVIVDLHAVAHVKKLVVYNILEIVSEIISAVYYSDRVKCNILVIDFKVVFKLTL